jgi:hypothetical protein
MSDSRFDDLTKALATPSSRRGALKSFAATAVGGLLALGGLSNASAHSQGGQASSQRWRSVDAPTIAQCPNGAGCATACGTNPSCACVSTTLGKNVCVIPVCTFVPCTKSSDCPAGSVCFTQGCCGAGNFCVPRCGH